MNFNPFDKPQYFFQFDFILRINKFNLPPAKDQSFHEQMLEIEIRIERIKICNKNWKGFSMTNRLIDEKMKDILKIYREKKPYNYGYRK